MENPSFNRGALEAQAEDEIGRIKNRYFRDNGGKETIAGIRKFVRTPPTTAVIGASRGKPRWSIPTSEVVERYEMLFVEPAGGADDTQVLPTEPPGKGPTRRRRR